MEGQAEESGLEPRGNERWKVLGLGNDVIKGVFKKY